MRALVWLLAMGLLVAMLVFRPQIVGTGSDLAPAAAPAFYAAWCATSAAHAISILASGDRGYVLTSRAQRKPLTEAG
jgi:hypothetical protein